MTSIHNIASLRLVEAAPPFVRPRRRPVRVAIAGYGNVGQALVERLVGDQDFEVCAILVRDPGRPRRVPPPCPLTTDRRELLASEADVLIDVLSCAETGALLSQGALARGIHLVSASKRVIAGCHATLDDCAKGSGAHFHYSAAVGGETPILETVRAAAREGEVASVTAILNGTVNFILDGLSRGLGFEAALKAAQDAGFAEEDPSEDLSGADATAKLRIVAATAFGGVPADYDFPAEPLAEATARRIAASSERWVQLARVERRDGRVTGSVELRPRSAAGALPLVEREWNCALVTTADGFSRTCFGRGAGGAPTAGAILADLAQLTRDVL
jgi:homoserine dehydrogenase